MNAAALWRLKSCCNDGILLGTVCPTVVMKRLVIWTIHLHNSPMNKANISTWNKDALYLCLMQLLLCKNDLLYVGGVAQRQGRRSFPDLRLI